MNRNKSRLLYRIQRTSLKKDRELLFIYAKKKKRRSTTITQHIKRVIKEAYL
jgi:hypothetical protein